MHEHAAARSCCAIASTKAVSFLDHIGRIRITGFSWEKREKDLKRWEIRKRFPGPFTLWEKEGKAEEKTSFALLC